MTDYETFDYWPEEKYWVVEVFARDTLSNGTYRIAKVVGGPEEERKKAKAQADLMNAQVSALVCVKDRVRTGVMYLVWSNWDVKEFKRCGTTIIGRME